MKIPTTHLPVRVLWVAASVATLHIAGVLSADDDIGLPQVAPSDIFQSPSRPTPQPEAAVEPAGQANPFTALPPGWEPLEDRRPANKPWQSSPETRRSLRDVVPEERLVPVQAVELPAIPAPVVDTAAASLVSPMRAAQAHPVLSPPEPTDEELPVTFVPRPVSEEEPSTAPAEATATSASAEDLEGMLHGMVWITATIGLGAVVSLWMLKLWLTRGGRGVLPSKSLKLVDTLRIGPRCGVYLVQAEAHRVLVGVEHGKTMCLMPLPADFSESLEAADSAQGEETAPAGGFERVADLFSALRHEERSKGAAS
ncbi:Flagellar biosynthesis protein, FliO [Caulifigura coniformis]|uniref:Flagellar biosynthesis protein, FliO n=1 Tax=Caulifigura coniformis TaxID=2527983 RepID=A0A517SJC3_9PLAN|nr:flagellar biosynthetic protein FliO [Caulifigura coniformis]QDT56224.1 Flagellar biosynthesis protein, FliO [Caulifigura coniformis]